MNLQKQKGNLGKRGQHIYPANRFNSLHQLMKILLKVYSLFLLIASFAVQATQDTPEAPSLSLSTVLSQTWDIASSPLVILDKEVQPVRFQMSMKLGQFSVFPAQPNTSPPNETSDAVAAKTMLATQKWEQEAVYVLLSVAALTLLFILFHYWRIRRQRRVAKYVSVKEKFIISFLFAAIWAALSIYLARYWLHELSTHIGVVLATTAILGIAIIPGFMNAFLLTSLIMDRRPEGKRLEKYPSFTILIAAYNEAAIIAKTLKSIDLQAYPALFEVIVIDDGSRDATAAIVVEEGARYPWLKFIRMSKNGGKANALNQGLAAASHPLIVTLDADSYLYADSLQSIVERYEGDPPHTRVVAGTVLVQNSRESWITKAQEWDYFHGISAIKRVQSLFQGTLVAQGAFSLYDKQTLIEVGGWPDCVGEDIVLTWAILKRGYRVGHCEDACIFTNVPATLKQFSRQRQRWSRGMIEAFKKHPGILLTPRLSTFFIYWNLLFPLLDFVFTLFFIPGLVLALFGYYWIVGSMTLALLPIAMAMNYIMFFFGKKMFDKRKLRVRTNIDGFFIYTLGYSLIMQPVCLWGYLSELLNLKKNWGTK